MESAGWETIEFHLRNPSKVPGAVLIDAYCVAEKRDKRLDEFGLTRVVRVSRQTETQNHGQQAKENMASMAAAKDSLVDHFQPGRNLIFPLAEPGRLGGVPAEPR